MSTATPRRVSSRFAFFNKWILPLAWFGVLAVFAFAQLQSFFRNEGSLPDLLPVLALAASGLLLFTRPARLVDVVYDLGDALLVRKGRREERIAFSDIVSVSFDEAYWVTLLLSRPSAFGGEIEFLAPATFPSFARSPVLRELALRIDRARR